MEKKAFVTKEMIEKIAEKYPISMMKRESGRMRRR